MTATSKTITALFAGALLLSGSPAFANGKPGAGRGTYAVGGGGSSASFRSTSAYRPTTTTFRSSTTYKPATFSKPITTSYRPTSTFKPATYSTATTTFKTTTNGIRPAAYTTKPGTTFKTTAKYTTTTNGLRAGVTFKAPGVVRGPRYSTVARVNTAAYASRFGVRLKSGYFAYKGIGHRHWARKFYSARWRTWCWYDPCTLGWYYWCGPRGMYLPCRYLPVAAPTVIDPGSEVVPPEVTPEVPVDGATSAATIDPGAEARANVPPDSAEVEKAGPDEVPDLPEPPAAE